MSKTFTVKNKKELIKYLITSEDVVLDVGFWGQGIKLDSPHWPHRLLLDQAKSVYGIDIEYDETKMPQERQNFYKKAAAENFSFEKKFDVVFAGDLIEHLINPGLFLENVEKNISAGGRLIMSTPNTFNLFNLAGKLTNDEPVVNSDHTFYFNHKTLGCLLKKCGWEVEHIGYMYSLEYDIKESYKKKFLNVLYKLASYVTPKYYETLIIVATVNKNI
jgi:2-polyprenyl-3-methyl-5-hydroxy-6-metoxy-1,4-benzoquinol methylase